MKGYSSLLFLGFIARLHGAFMSVALQFLRILTSVSRSLAVYTTGCWSPTEYRRVRNQKWYYPLYIKDLEKQKPMQTLQAISMPFIETPNALENPKRNPNPRIGCKTPTEALQNPKSNPGDCAPGASTLANRQELTQESIWNDILSQ